MKYYLLGLAFTIITQIRAQSAFNVLDSSSSVHGSIIVTDSTYFVAGRTFNAQGESKIVLHKYSFSGQELYFDTLPDSGVSYNGKIEIFGNSIVLYNGINSVPPFNPSTANLSLHIKSPFDLASINQFNYNDPGEQIPTCMLILDTLFYLGSSSGSSGIGDFNLIKIDTAGNVIWNNNYGNFNNTERLFSIGLTNDNNLMLAGDRKISGSDWNLVFIKIDLDGNVIWEKEYGFGLTDYNGTTIQLNDHSFIVYHSVSNGSTSIGYIDKLDGNGDLIWSKAFPYNNYSSFAYAAPYEDDDGTIIVCQSIKNASDIVEQRILRLSPLGETIWEKIYLTRTDLSQYINDIVSTPDGGFMAGGSAFPVGNNTAHTWLIKANCLGEEGTQYQLSGSPCDQYDCNLYPIDASFTSSTTYIDLATQTGLVNFENNSSNATSRVWNFGDGSTDYTDSIMSYTYTQPGIYEAELIVFHGMCSDTIIQTIEVVNSTGLSSPNLDFGLKVYPNPSNGSFVLSFKYAPKGSYEIVDLAGSVHREQALNGSLNYSVNNLEQGAYLLHIDYLSGVRETVRIVVK